MNAWCHGAPGILFARMMAADAGILDNTEWGMRKAVEAVFYQNPENHGCICHGFAGNLLVMRAYLKAYPDQALRNRYEAFACQFCKTLVNADNFSADEYWNPSFMTGITGIGAALIYVFWEK